MPIYENINSPFIVGDIVRRAPGVRVYGPADDPEDDPCGVPNGVFKVTRVAASSYFENTYYMTLEDLRTGREWRERVDSDYLVKDVFLDAAVRANGKI